MKRVLVIGHPGAGKSTLATKLGKTTGLSVVHLDQEFWRPGWVMTPVEEWRPRVQELVNRDKWIMDGSFDGTLDIRLPRADTVIVLDFSRYRCLWRVCKRVAASFGRVRPDMAEGCPERIDLEFLRFVWNYRRDRYPIVTECLQTYYADGRTVVLKTPAAVTHFLSELL